MRSLVAAAVALLCSACGVLPPFVADPGDCALHPVEVASIAAAVPTDSLVASSCAQIVQVGDVRYVNQGDWKLLPETIAQLRENGRIGQANQAWSFNIETAADLTVWEVAGVDPSLALWGTSASIRGSDVYVLWVVDDCSELDACTPDICRLVVPDSVQAEERCTTA